MKKLFFSFFIIFFVLNILYGEKFTINVVYVMKNKAVEEILKGVEEVLSSNNIEASFNILSLDNNKSIADIISSIRNYKPNLIIALGTDIVKALKGKINDIPIFYSMVYSEDLDLLHDNNFTGIFLDIPARYKIDIIRKFSNNVKKFGFLYSENSKKEFEDLSRVCSEFNIDLISDKIDDLKEFSPKLSNIFSKKVDIFLIGVDYNIYFPQSIKLLLKKSYESKIPVIGLSRNFTEAGCLFSIEADYFDIGKNLGSMICRYLNGEKISSIKPTNPKNLNVTTNLTVSKMLGIEVPERFIKDSREVFK